MSSHKTRLTKLEEKYAPRVRHYMLVTEDGKPTGASPAEAARGYKIQPMQDKEHYTPGDVFYLSTWEEVEQFTAAPDVELKHIDIEYIASTSGNDDTEVIDA